MDFLELAEIRYSVRAYHPDPIPEDLLRQVLEAARLAPTAHNNQPFRLIVIPTAGRRDALKRVYNRDWFAEAPIVIAAVAVPGEAWTSRDGRNYAWVDATIAMDHLILAATDLGLGTCWIAAFDPAAARDVLGLPDDAELVAVTPLGFPADEPGFKRRKNMDKIVRYETW